MELDKRIKSLSDILTCFDVERAKEFLGEKGYFADAIVCYQFLSDRHYDTLTHLKDDERPFKEGKNSHWRYFIPECSLKPKEKQYRPYTFMEFEDKFHFGLPITFRKKGEKKDEWFSVLMGYWKHQIGGGVITYIFIGPCQYTLDELFEHYEFFCNGRWYPFGVEVKE